MDDLERIPLGVEYIGGIVSRIVFHPCAGRNVVPSTSRHCGLVEFIDLLFIFGHETPVNGCRIRLPLLYPEERLLAVTKSPQVRMTVLALVRHEEFDMKRLQGRLIEGQRTFDIADGQNDVVEHRSPPPNHGCFKRSKGCVSRFHDELPFARPTQSFAEERRQDSLQVRLSAPERMTAFPDHDVGIEDWKLEPLLQRGGYPRFHAEEFVDYSSSLWLVWSGKRGKERARIASHANDQRQIGDAVLVGLLHQQSVQPVFS